MNRGTKKTFDELTLEDIEQIVYADIDEVNHGSVITSDELIKKAMVAKVPSEIKKI